MFVLSQGDNGGVITAPTQPGQQQKISNKISQQPKIELKNKSILKREKKEEKKRTLKILISYCINLYNKIISIIYIVKQTFHANIQLHIFNLWAMLD